MKSRLIKCACIILTAVLVLVSGIAVNAYSAKLDCKAEGEEIIGYKLSQAQAEDIQAFIDGYIASNAGNSEAEWYAYSLARSGEYNFSAYHKAAESAVAEKRLTAVDKLRIAIACYGTGDSSMNVGAIIDENVRGLGIMSEIYGLILMNMGDFRCNTDEAELVKSLLERQLEDGGWALSGKYSDPDVTSMTLQALSPYRNNSQVRESVLRGFSRLSEMQQSDGGYKSYGTSNAESCVQVILALCQYGIDPLTDSRFVKNGNTAADALMKYRCDSGGFSHIMGGSENTIATVQAYEAMVALMEFSESGIGFYTLLQRDINLSEEEPPVVTSALTKQTNTTTTAAQTTKSKPAEGSVTSAGSSVSDIVSKTAQPQTHTSAVTFEADNETTAALQSDAVTVITEITADTDITEHSDSAGSVTSKQTETTAVSEAVLQTGEDNTSGGGQRWRIFAYITIAGIFAASQIYFAACRRFSLKNFLLSAGVCAACAGVVSFIEIQTPEEYYSRNIDDIQPDSLTVTMSVSCEVIADKIDGDFVIIPETEYVLLENDTAFDILERVLAYNRIPFDYSGGAAGDVYIKGINGIYEMDFGEMSGWMYRVNGEFQGEGCASYKPDDGDLIEWLYTLETGRDIGAEEYSQ